MNLQHLFISEVFSNGDIYKLSRNLFTKNLEYLKTKSLFYFNFEDSEYLIVRYLDSRTGPIELNLNFYMSIFSLLTNKEIKKYASIKLDDMRIEFSKTLNKVIANVDQDFNTNFKRNPTDVELFKVAKEIGFPADINVNFIEEMNRVISPEVF